ncbi:MAG: AAA family ATPase [Bacillota bacterium]|nr:AAA family ATPase [Bacillota bacterium]
MRIDLEGVNIFKENSVDLDKKVCFIFGNNGTGKSTLSNHLKESLTNYDVRLFQGFKSVVNNNDELNAVVLGEQNVDIDRQLKEIDIEIERINRDKIEKTRLIDPQYSDEENIYHKKQKSQQEFESFSNKIEKFYSQEAARIKKYDPRIAKTSYDKNCFIHDIEFARLLSEDDEKESKNLIMSGEKNAPCINFPKIDARKELDIVNNLLVKTVEEPIEIPRLKGNEDKREFAKKGLQIHKAGDKCSFCGNEIMQETFFQLEKYFSAEEIAKLENELKNKVEYLLRLKEEIEKVEMSIENFYSSNFEEFGRIEKEFQDTKKELLKFLNTLIDHISNKQKKLFSKAEEIEINIPNNFKKVKEDYDNLCKLNNSSDLALKKLKAKEKLRFHEVKKSLSEYNYSEKLNELEKRKNLYDELKLKYDSVEDEIKKLQEKIDLLNVEKLELKVKSKNEEKLATEVNKLLGLYVNFNLVYFKHEQFGYYRVESKINKEIRDVKHLSKGEKNIIAFLYFIKKLEEVADEKTNKKKIIVFDDPMTSNDNNMQYVMIEELQSLINRTQNDENIEKLIIMTHNHHFYLNLTRYLKDRYNKYKFLRFNSDGNRTKIREIKNSDEDFKSNYDALWQDLKFVYESEGVRPGLLCNIARRIIDTFTKFNSISKTKFYKNTKGAKKLFDVNSHEIEDFDADLTGVSKKKIIKILQHCFEKNNGSEHFKKYFPIEIDEMHE